MLEMSIQTDIPAELSASSTKAAVVTTMAVLPKLQRQGIGSALLLAAQDWALTQDTALMALFVYRDNYAAIRSADYADTPSAFQLVSAITKVMNMRMLRPATRCECMWMPLCFLRLETAMHTLQAVREVWFC